MRAISLLNEYKSVDFGCYCSELHSDIDKAIDELNYYIKKHEELENESGSYAIALEELRKELDCIKSQRLCSECKHSGEFKAIFHEGRKVMICNFCMHNNVSYFERK